jgi:hypothetical protein
MVSRSVPSSRTRRPLNAGDAGALPWVIFGLQAGGARVPVPSHLDTDMGIGLDVADVAGGAP